MIHANITIFQFDRIKTWTARCRSGYLLLPVPGKTRIHSIRHRTIDKIRLVSLLFDAWSIDLRNMLWVSLWWRMSQSDGIHSRTLQAKQVGFGWMVENSNEGIKNFTWKFLLDRNFNTLIKRKSRRCVQAKIGCDQSRTKQQYTTMITLL